MTKEQTDLLPDDDELKEWADRSSAFSMTRYVMAAEILRLRAELAKASAEVQRLESERGQFGPCSDGWTYSVDSVGWRYDLSKPSSVSLVRRSRDNPLGEVLNFVPKPPEPHQFTGAEALAPSYEASQAVAKDAAPADVLGESLRGRLCAAMLDERVSPSIYGAVHELAQVVERIARAQRAGGAK